MSENIENITKSNSNFASTFVDHYLLPHIYFNGHCLIKNSIYNPNKVVSIYISYALTLWFRNLNTYFALKNFLFGSVKLTKNTDTDKYKYSDYGIGFDSCSEFLFTDESMGKMSLFMELI